MRYYQKGKVLRVARARDGLVAALYPTGQDGIFQTEAFTQIDQESAMGTISAKEIKDEVWMKLLNGKSIETILAGYMESTGCHTYLPASDDSLRHLRAPTFRIAEDREEAA